MRARYLAPALCFLILPSSVPGAAMAEPPEAALHHGEDLSEADERRLTAAREASDAAPLRPTYWPAVLSFGVAGTALVIGLSATLAANSQIDAADRVLRGAAATTPGDRVVCPVGTESPPCLEVSARLADARRLEHHAIAGYAAGAMAAAIGAALTAWPIQVRAGGRAAAVAPVTSSRGGGLLVVGTF